MPEFKNIPQFPTAHYETNVSFWYLERHLEHWKREMGLTLDPDFQRGHVWTEAQQIAYVEYFLRGGEVGRSIIINCPTWDKFRPGDVSEVVDGKQRLTALTRFLANEIPVFGHLRSEYTDKLPIMTTLLWRVVRLDRLGVLRLYLSLNGGGTDHTPAELDRVRGLIADELLVAGGKA